MIRRLVPLLTLALLCACTSTRPSPGRTIDTAGLPGPVDSASLTAPHPDGPSGDSELLTTVGAIHCGYERWPIKTGTDQLASRVNLTPKPATIRALVSETSQLPKVTGKYPPQTPRRSAEMQAYTVTGTITAYNVEQDSDLHLVFASGADHMIIEIPNPACVKGGPFLSGIVNARNAFLAKTGYKPPVVPPGQYNPPFVTTSLKASVTGVQFWDFVHGQYGVARNGVELHPVLSMSFP